MSYPNPAIVKEIKSAIERAVKDPKKRAVMVKEWWLKKGHNYGLKAHDLVRYTIDLGYKGTAFYLAHIAHDSELEFLEVNYGRKAT